MTRSNRYPDQLAERLDQTVPPLRAEVTPAADDPLVAIAQKLATSEHPVLPPEKKERIQARVLDAHRQLRKSRRRYRLATVQRALVVTMMLELLVLIPILVGIAPQISASVPGDWFYPFKRAAESVEMAVADITQDDVTIYTELAGRRTEEVIILLGRGQFDVDLMTEAVADLSKANQSVAATESPELAAQTTLISALLVTAVERAGQNDDFATEESIETLNDMIRSMPGGGNLQLPNSPTVTPTPSTTPVLLPTPTLTPPRH